ncbi:hypothetical protein GCM10010335_11880 [Streptomyces galbus]|nr:hypothetical protein GCM10010335_11880 [Streptomyces galbus]
MARWAACGGVGHIRDQLRTRMRREMGKAPGAVATVIDPQSVQAASTVGKDSRGYDAGKRSNGRKRHLVVDPKGLPLPPEERPRVRRAAPALGRRTLTRRAMHVTPARARLRTAHPALGIAHHLSRDHPDDQAHHPQKLPQERTTGLPRSPMRLIASP